MRFSKQSHLTHIIRRGLNLQERNRSPEISRRKSFRIIMQGKKMGGLKRMQGSGKETEETKDAFRAGGWG